MPAMVSYGLSYCGVALQECYGLGGIFVVMHPLYLLCAYDKRNTGSLCKLTHSLAVLLCYFLQYNANVNLATNSGLSALHLAVGKGFNQLIELLVDSGARVNAVDEDGDTPMHVALMKQQIVSSDQPSILRTAVSIAAFVSAAAAFGLSCSG